LGALNFLYGVFVLPESLPKERRRAFEWKRANPLGTLTSMRRYPAVIAIASAVFLWQLAHQVYPSTWSFFAKLRFDWSEAMIGASLAFVGVMMAFTQGYLTGKIVPRIGEYRAVIVGVTSGVSQLAGAGVRDPDLGRLRGHGDRLAAGARVSVDERDHVEASAAGSAGRAARGVSSMMSLTTILGPLIMTQTLGRFFRGGGARSFSGAAFLLASVLGLISLALVVADQRAQFRVAGRAQWIRSSPAQSDIGVSLPE
jgi:DHA1 family tetracycline resistance protein-like MFS transporter